DRSLARAQTPTKETDRARARWRSDHGPSNALDRRPGRLHGQILRWTTRLHHHWTRARTLAVRRRGRPCPSRSREMSAMVSRCAASLPRIACRRTTSLARSRGEAQLLLSVVRSTTFAEGDAGEARER